MRTYDLLELAGRNLREAGLRNSLTTVGIGVGVASLVAMVSLGVGLQRLVSRELGRSGLFDSIFVTARLEGRAARFAQTGTPPSPAKPLDDAARKSFQQIAGVTEVYSSFTAVGEFRLEGSKDDPHFTVVSGIPPSVRNSEAFDDFQGTFFSAPDAAEIIILADFGRDLLGLPPDTRDSDQKLTSEQASQLLGKYVVLRYPERQVAAPPAASSDAPKKEANSKDSAQNKDKEKDLPPEDLAAFNVVRKEQRLQIVGITSIEPSGGVRNGRTSAFLPIAFAESLNMVQPGDLRNILRPGQGKAYSVLIVRAASGKAVPQVEEEIKKLGFTARSIQDASRGIRVVFIVLATFLGVFGSLALAVASLGVINTMVMAILERRREIGIMKALGASDGDVKMIFFVEAGSMGVLGGALGVGLGWLIGRVINAGANFYFGRFGIHSQNFWYVPLWLALAALVFSLIVSLIAALYPASRAARLDPVQALRND